jgi:hypothetical protein
MLVRNVRDANNKEKHLNVYIGYLITDPYGKVIRKASPLNNPFRIMNRNDQAQRDESIQKYKSWLWTHIKNRDDAHSAKIWEALRSLRPDSILLCHCYPNYRPCHGEIIVKAWHWAHTQGLITPVYTPHSSTATIEYKARSNAKALDPQQQKPAPRDESAVMTELARLQIVDAKLDEEFLERYPEGCTEHTACNALARTLPPRKKQGIGAPRPRRTLTYSVADPRYNRMDEMTADLEELYTTASYIDATRAVA